MAILLLAPSKGGNEECKLEMLWLLSLHGNISSSCMLGLWDLDCTLLLLSFSSDSLLFREVQTTL